MSSRTPRIPTPRNPTLPNRGDTAETRAPVTGGGEAREPERAVAGRAPAHRRDGAFPVTGWRLLLETLTCASLAGLFAGVLYRVWDIRWDVPIYQDGSDARFIGMLLKGMQDHGWYLTNPQLNAPFQQQLYDFPHGGETTQIAALNVLLEVVPGYGQAMNVYYLGGFLVLAAVAFLVLRHLRFPFVVCLVLAIAYTFLPFHVAHHQSHLFRSTYLTAPLGALLLLWSLSWRSWFLVRPEPPPGVRWRANLRTGRVVAAAAIAAFVAITETMTTSFTMALLGASALVAAVRWREPARLAVSGALIAVMFAAFLAASIPNLLYWAEHGRNEVAGKRLVAESEYYGLKISRLVLPHGDHRLEPWGEVGIRSQEGSPVPSEGGQYLGVFGIAGFMGALIGLLGRGIRRHGRRDRRPPDDREALVDHSSLVIVLAVLLGTIGGFSILLSVVGFSQVRTWGRIEVIIAFLALVVFAVWFERLTRWLRRRVRRPAALVALLTLIAVLGSAFAVWDGIPKLPRDYRALEADWVSDARFVNDIERRMPDDTAIFQLPIMPFPEAGVLERMKDYDLLRGYLQDDGTLRWSYGGIKGRATADWQLRVRDHIGPVGALPALIGMGYTGLWVDTFGYADGAAGLRGELEAVIRAAPMVSQNGRMLFYDLRPLQRRLERDGGDLEAEARRMLRISPP